MADHDDMAHLQLSHCKLESSAGAVIICIGSVRRHESSDIADDEDLARRGIEDDLRCDPRITAGNDKGLGRLAFCRQCGEELLMLSPKYLAETMISADQIIHVSKDLN